MVHVMTQLLVGPRLLLLVILAVTHRMVLVQVLFRVWVRLSRCRAVLLALGLTGGPLNGASTMYLLSCVGAFGWEMNYIWVWAG